MNWYEGTKLKVKSQVLYPPFIVVLLKASDAPIISTEPENSSPSEQAADQCRNHLEQTNFEYQ